MRGRKDGQLRTGADIFPEPDRLCSLRHHQHVNDRGGAVKPPAAAEVAFARGPAD